VTLCDNAAGALYIVNSDKAILQRVVGLLNYEIPSKYQYKTSTDCNVQQWREKFIDRDDDDVRNALIYSLRRSST